MRTVPNLSISPEKAFFIIAKARQSDSGASGPGAQASAATTLLGLLSECRFR